VHCSRSPVYPLALRGGLRYVRPPPREAQANCYPRHPWANAVVLALAQSPICPGSRTFGVGHSGLTDAAVFFRRHRPVAVPGLLGMPLPRLQRRSRDAAAQARLIPPSGLPDQTEMGYTSGERRGWGPYSIAAPGSLRSLRISSGSRNPACGVLAAAPSSSRLRSRELSVQLPAECRRGAEALAGLGSNLANLHETDLQDPRCSRDTISAGPDHSTVWSGLRSLLVGTKWWAGSHRPGSRWRSASAFSDCRWRLPRYVSCALAFPATVRGRIRPSRTWPSRVADPCKIQLGRSGFQFSGYRLCRVSVRRRVFPRQRGMACWDTIAVQTPFGTTGLF